MTDNSLKKSPLHDAHVARNAKMADFGGWDMPIEFPGGLSLIHISEPTRRT